MWDNNYQPKPAFSAALSALGGGGGGGNTVTVTKPGQTRPARSAPRSACRCAPPTPRPDRPSPTRRPAAGGPRHQLGNGCHLWHADDGGHQQRDHHGQGRHRRRRHGRAELDDQRYGWRWRRHLPMSPIPSRANGPAGFVANLTLANTGTSTISPWTLTYSFPGDQKISNAWNATGNPERSRGQRDRREFQQQHRHRARASPSVTRALG